MGLPVFAHDAHTYPLPPGHRFPLARYGLARKAVERLAGVQIHEARSAAPDEIALGHSPDYVARVESGRLSRREQLALGLPWSFELVERARRSVGATIAAARATLAGGYGANLGGGTHHAFRDAGRGFCVFNDVVCATRELRRARTVERVLVIDLDVHQGDGTHAALGSDPLAFTLSLNGFGNYPFRRVPGDLELDLRDGTGDDEYLDAVARLLPVAIANARPELAFYLAGADPYAGDRLGRLALSMPGLETRDELVLDLLDRAGVPVCVTLAGGYADPIEDTVAINVTTIRVLARRAG